MRKKVSTKLVVSTKKRSPVRRTKRVSRTVDKGRRTVDKGRRTRGSVAKAKQRRSVSVRKIKRRSGGKKVPSKRALVARKLKVSLENFCKSRMSNIIKKSIVNRMVRKSLNKRLKKSLKKLSMKGGQGPQENVPKRTSKRPPRIIIPRVRVINNRLQEIEVINGSRRKVREI